MARLGLSAALLSLGLAVAALLWAVRLHLPPGEVAAGVRIAGLAVEPRADVGVLVDDLTRRFQEQQVAIAAGGTAADTELRATLGELGFGVDREAVVARARAFGRQGTWLGRARELERLRASGADLPLAVTFDTERFFAVLAAFKARHDRPAVPARLLAESRTLAPHVPGRYVDLDGLGELLWSVAKARARGIGAAAATLEPARLAAPFVEIAPRVSAEAAAELSGELQVVSQYSTRFRSAGDQATRAQNIAVAAQRLDGWVLLPGDRMSFNDVVGERSAENGFEESWQILEGEMVRGMGGGTCQVSSTLHAAALHAGLTVVESYPHSRPLAYIDKGLDATVAWPFVDLELQNPWTVAVAIDAEVEGGTLTFRFLARSKPATVRIRRDTKEVVPFPRIVEVSRRLRGFKRKQEGIPGYEIERVRYIQPASGAARREVQTNRYRPTPELYLVGPDFDVEQLPPLPEGAEGHSPSATEPELPQGEGAVPAELGAADATGESRPGPAGSTAGLRPEAKG